jgi:hypothetical protein
MTRDRSALRPRAPPRPPARAGPGVHNAPRYRTREPSVRGKSWGKPVDDALQQTLIDAPPQRGHITSRHEASRFPSVAAGSSGHGETRHVGRPSQALVAMRTGRLGDADFDEAGPPAASALSANAAGLAGTDDRRRTNRAARSAARRVRSPWRIRERAREGLRWAPLVPTTAPAGGPPPPRSTRPAPESASGAPRRCSPRPRSERRRPAPEGRPLSPASRCSSPTAARPP